MKEPLGLKVSCTKGQEVNGREPGLLPRWNEHNDREFRGVLADGMIDGLHHSNETRLGVCDVEALDVQVERYGPNVGMEAKETVS